MKSTRAILVIAALLGTQPLFAGFSTYYGWSNSAAFYDAYRGAELYAAGDFPEEEVYGSSSLYLAPIEGDLDLPLFGRMLRAGMYGKIGLGFGIGFSNMGDWTTPQNRVKAGFMEKHGLTENPEGPVPRHSWVYAWDYNLGLSATFSPYAGRKFTLRWYRRTAKNPTLNFHGSDFRGYRRSNVIGFSTDFISGLRIGGEWDPLEGEKGETRGRYWGLSVDKFLDGSGTSFVGLRWESLSGIPLRSGEMEPVSRGNSYLSLTLAAGAHF